MSLTLRHPAHSMRRTLSVQEHLCKHKMDAIRAWTRSQQASGKRNALADKARRGIHKVSTRGSRGSASATERPAHPAHLRGAGHARNSSEVDVGHLGEGLVEERSLADGFQRCTVGGSAAGPSLLSEFCVMVARPSQAYRAAPLALTALDTALHRCPCRPPRHVRTGSQAANT